MGTPYHHSFSTPSGGPGIRIDRESPWPWRGEAFRIELWGNPEGWSQVVELRFAVLRFVPNGNSPWMSLFVSSYTKNGGFSHCYVRFTGGYMFFFKNLIVWLFLNGFQPKMGFLGDWWVFFLKLRFKIRLPHIHLHKTKLKKDDTDGDLKPIRVFGKSLVPNLSARGFKKHIYPST